MYCSKCGKQLESGSKFCANCGNYVGNGNVKKNISNQKLNKVGHSLKSNVAILLIVCLVSVLAALYFFNKSSKMTTDNKTGGIFFGGHKYDDEEIEKTKNYGIISVVVTVISGIGAVFYFNNTKARLELMKEDDIDDTPNYMQELESLKKSYNKKEITKEEYEKKKKKILDRM